MRRVTNEGCTDLILFALIKIRIISPHQALRASFPPQGEAMLIPLLLLLFALMHSGTKLKEAIHRYPFQSFSFAACGGSPRVVMTAECSLSICISEMMRSISAVCSGWSLSNCSKARSTRVSISDSASDSR